MGTSYGNSFDPRSLSPALWLSDTGSDPAVWEDLSGNGRNATQATASAQPAIVSNALNGRQVRRFDGVNDTMTFARFDLSAFTVFAVAQRSSGGGTYQTIFQVLQASTTRAAVEIGINNDNAYGPLVVGSDGNSTTYGRGGSLAENSSRIISAIWSGGSTNGASNYSLWTNGAATPLTNSGRVGAASGSISRIGSTASGGSIVSYLRGDISEILIFPTALSTSDRKSVENYLAKKWGLGFNPLSLGPALWLSDTGSNPAQWDDISGNNRHATQATVASQPAIIANGLGGRQVRRFDGGDWMQAGTNSTWNFLHNGTASHVFIAVKCGIVENPNSIYSLISTGGDSSANIGYSLTYDDRSANSRNNVMRALAARGAPGQFACDSITQNAITPNQFNILTNRIEAGNATASLRSQSRVNGTDIANNNTLINAPSTANSTRPLQIGADGSALFLNGDIAEILVFPSALSTTDRREVERYLAQKWNIIP
jgi:hypothetical protein